MLINSFSKNGAFLNTANRYQKLIDSKMFVASFKSYMSDISFIAKGDPATGGNPNLVDDSYGTARAIAGYRIATALIGKGFDQEAFMLSEWIYEREGIFIHPKCHIGNPFSLDHGIGTYIGESTIIGQYCLILNNVTLELDKTGNAPEIKDWVTLCAGVHLTGDSKVARGKILPPIVENQYVH